MHQLLLHSQYFAKGHKVVEAMHEFMDIDVLCDAKTFKTKAGFT